MSASKIQEDDFEPHFETISKCLSHFGSDFDEKSGCIGLSSKSANAALEKYGQNRLKEEEKQLRFFVLLGIC